MPTLLLDGTVTALSPIAIILPGSEDNRTPAGPPRKRMLRDGVLVDTVYVPASSLRGRLRHLLTSELMRLQHAADGRVFSPEDYIDTALGGVKDRKAAGEDDRKIDLKAIQELRQRNPVVSLFGSIVAHVAGRLMVGDMTPETPIAPVSTGRSVRANPFVRNPAIIEVLDPAKFEEFTRLNDRRTEANRAEDQAERLGKRLAGRKRAGATDEEVATLMAEIAALDQQAKAGFAAAGGAVNIQQLLDGFETIPEGTTLTNRLRLLDGTEQEVALLVLALDLLARRPFIGGHTAQGCGEITGSWRLRWQDGATLRELGTLRVEPYAGLVRDSADPMLDAAIARARAFAGEVKGIDLRGA